ncbi:hypothetical protein O4214_20675 [Rhodococcus erythropolis]|uniref:hypothetical protein n=1 Tax=Rhodococcus erythropolis TaxID=1833 RepID=UPI001E335E41|nr:MULTISPECIES: hypothetical protein [Rhodococcus erythropolis group]MCD2104934.1 hypothetical protein [Rhodococcus qingshengii]MCZ4526405.1 hypothetical protein [Rhodococcus erythropolis]
MTSSLTATDYGTTLDFTYEDALRYHGPQAPGGVAHAYKVLERALGVFGGEGSVERRDLVVATSHAGPGVRDAFELVTRAVTEGRYTVDSSLARPERGNALALYVFRVDCRGATVTLTIREGFVVEEFSTLARKGDRTAEDESRLTVLKQEMADRVMSSPAESVYDVEVDTLPD